MPMPRPQSLAARALRALLLPACAALALAACGSSGGGSAPQEVRVRVLHLAADAPRINVLVDRTVVRSAVDYKSGTGFLSLTAGRAYDFAIDALVPGATQRILELQDRSPPGGTVYTIVAVGKAATSSVEALEFENPIVDIGSGQLLVQLLHAAPDVPVVDVFVTEPGADLGASTAVATLAYKESTDRFALAAGTYRIRVTPAGDPGTIVFDSGAVTFAAGRDLFVAAVPNTLPGAAPISLVGDNGAGQPQIVDLGTPVQVRALHLSANTPPIQVTADPETEGSPTIDLTAGLPEGLEYAGVTPYQVIPPDRYAVRAVEFASPATQAFAFSQTYVPGSRVSALLVGRKAEGTTGSTQAPVTLFDSVRPIHEIAQLRFVNASPGATPLDVYVLPPGTAIAGSNPFATGIGLGVATGYLQLSPGNYEVTIARANTSTAVVALGVTLGNGSAVTVISRDTAPGGTPIQLFEEADL